MRVVATISILLSSILLTQCDSEENFPVEPYIEFRSLSFVETENPTIPDTLKLSFYFRDGDFDLGIDPNEIDPPFNPYNYYFKDGTNKPSFDKLRLVTCYHIGTKNF